MRKAFACARLLAALVCVVALAARLVWSLGISGPIVANFFSYFTMQSAIAAATLWVIGGIIGLRRATDPPWLASARAVVTTYQILSGVVFGIITIGAIESGFPMLVPWSSDVLHYWLTGYAILDWIFAPGRPAPRWRVLSTLLPLPILWTVYTLVRGPIVGWYPYFFLDPTLVRWTETAAYLVAASVFSLAVCAALVGIARLSRRARSLTPADEHPLRVTRETREEREEQADVAREVTADGRSGRVS